MKINPQLKNNIIKVIIITMGYILINIFIAFYNQVIVTSNLSLGESALNNFLQNVIENIMIGLTAGILGGSALVYLNGYVFRKRSFGEALITTAVSFCTFFFFISLIVAFSETISRHRISDSYESYMIFLFQNLFNKITIIYFVLWGIIVLTTLFLLQVNDKFGPGILLQFLRGKFHRPRQVERIFMFLDMKSSTTVAEKLGNEKYFYLISNCFTDITSAIIKCEGEIYQYVGDEIVISWSLKKGLKNSNCIRCFFEIQKKLKRLGPLYLKEFGHSPEFKAGLHYGKVTAGEVGQIKRDIVFSGDILNTTSRIQDQCNKYNANFLASNEIISILNRNNDFHFQPIGEIQLKGKHTKILLNKINLNA